jgi:hypothetical protein
LVYINHSVAGEEAGRREIFRLMFVQSGGLNEQCSVEINFFRNFVKSIGLPNMSLEMLLQRIKKEELQAKNKVGKVLSLETLTSVVIVKDTRGGPITHRDDIRQWGPAG